MAAAINLHPHTVMVATGRNFPDALAAGATAAQDPAGAPAQLFAAPGPHLSGIAIFGGENAVATGVALNTATSGQRNIPRPAASESDIAGRAFIGRATPLKKAIKPGPK